MRWLETLIIRRQLNQLHQYGIISLEEKIEFDKRIDEIREN